MWRKRVSLALLTLISLSILSGAANPVQAAWGQSTMIANAGGNPIIDGNKDDLWSSTDVNVSYGTIGNRGISLFVIYEGAFLYVLVELKFDLTATAEESISLYISNSTDSETSDFTDKKQITMFNASDKGQEYSEDYDLYYTDAEEYEQDTAESGFVGAAAYGDEFRRFYEYKIKRSVDNTTENVEVLFATEYAFKVGYNTTSGDPDFSDTIVLQVGKPADSIEDIGEFEFPIELYIQIVLWVALGVVVLFGGLIGLKVTSLEKINDKDRKLVEGEY